MGQTNDRTAKRQSRKSDGARAPRFDGSRFVNYELDLAEQAQCKGWDVSSDDLWSEVLSLVDDGYTVSLKFDTFSEAYACFIQVRGQDDHQNSGFILTGRGSTPAKAFKQAVFKSRAIGPSWGEYAGTARPPIDD